MEWLPVDRRLVRAAVPGVWVARYRSRVAVLDHHATTCWGNAKDLDHGRSHRRAALCLRHGHSGHGPDGDRASIQRQVAYYDDLRAAVRRAGSPAMAKRSSVASRASTDTKPSRKEREAAREAP